jgi:hypothetical protein
VLDMARDHAFVLEGVDRLAVGRVLVGVDHRGPQSRERLMATPRKRLAAFAFLRSDKL